MPYNMAVKLKTRGAEATAVGSMVMVNGEAKKCKVSVRTIMVDARMRSFYHIARIN
jgi:hypothetical protein